MAADADQSQGSDSAHLPDAPAGQADGHAGRKHDNGGCRDEIDQRHIRRERMSDRNIGDHDRQLNEKGDREHAQQAEYEPLRQQGQHSTHRGAAISDQRADRSRGDEADNEPDQICSAGRRIDVDSAEHEIGSGDRQ